MTLCEEEEFFSRFSRTCFDSYYPFGIFSHEKNLCEAGFDDITVFCGSNGSGKSTLLNIIAEKLKLNRHTGYTKPIFLTPI